MCREKATFPRKDVRINVVLQQVLVRSLQGPFSILAGSLRAPFRTYFFLLDSFYLVHDLSRISTMFQWFWQLSARFQNISGWLQQKPPNSRRNSGQQIRMMLNDSKRISGQVPAICPDNFRPIILQKIREYHPRAPQTIPQGYCRDLEGPKGIAQGDIPPSKQLSANIASPQILSVFMCFVFGILKQNPSAKRRQF